MDYALDAIEIALLTYLALKAYLTKPTQLRDIVRDALASRVADGSGRERVRMRLAQRAAQRAREEVKA